ncbi:deoxyhypusine synthase [Candidatus Micrarchaeota archaeon]|nr:deoxyhypusine synthase [Candidatus Micrarchaeota archaeon]
MEVKDIHFGKAPSVAELVEAYGKCGFQGTHIKQGVELVREMKESGATIFLAFTANVVASGLRGVIADMVRDGYADVIVTTGGALDHDMIKAYEPYLLGSFYEDDKKLHKEEVNRIGNVLVPSSRYELLEEKIGKVFSEVSKENNIVSPSAIAAEMGRQIEDKGSFLRQAHLKGVPVFSPGITDSAIGLQTYFWKQKRENAEFGIDVTSDMKVLASKALDADKTGAIIIGGGISKHHTIGVNLMRGGLDYALYLTSAQEWDGSLSGAPAREAVSWGKIREEGKHATVHGDATVTLPLIYYSL